jgi:hypothetical protein
MNNPRGLVRCKAVKVHKYKWEFGKKIQCRLFTVDPSGLCHMHQKHPPKETVG